MQSESKGLPLATLVEAYAYGGRIALADEATAEAKVLDAKTRENWSPTLAGLLKNLDSLQSVVIEYGYYDLDARSEEALLLSRHFRFDAVSHDRLHFFDIEVTHSLVVDALTDPDKQTKLQQAYLGYSVLRRNAAAVVGRTMIVPPRRDEGLVEPGEFRLRVRTRVTEELTLAGIPLKVTGVPFMQQDETITRCAHVAVWSVHYTAVLRGQVPRVPVGQISGNNKYGGLAQYPSVGMTDFEVQGALAGCGLASRQLLIREQAVRQRDAWHHRPQLFKTATTTRRNARWFRGSRRRELTPAKAAWHAEAITTTICRYLNSGIPVLLASGEHIRIISGYLRSSHLQPTGSADANAPKSAQIGEQGGISEFILSDDGDRPYKRVPIRDVLWPLARGDTLIIPALPGMGLSGEVAEYLGAKFLRAGPAQGRELARKTGSSRLQSLMGLLEANFSSRRYAIRCFAMESNEFKRSFSKRCAVDRRACRVVATLRLPKYVWVVEMIDRPQRGMEDSESSSGPVVGQVLLDATATHYTQVESLLLYLPGFISLQDVVAGTSISFEARAKSYESGRWGHRNNEMDPALDPKISKTCGVYSVH